MPSPFGDDKDENSNDDDYSDGDNNDDDGGDGDNNDDDGGGDGHFISLGVCPVPSAFGNVLLKSCIWGQKSRNLHCEHISIFTQWKKEKH